MQTEILHLLPVKRLTGRQFDEDKRVKVASSFNELLWDPADEVFGCASLVLGADDGEEPGQACVRRRRRVWVEVDCGFAPEEFGEAVLVLLWVVCRVCDVLGSAERVYSLRARG